MNYAYYVAIHRYYDIQQKMEKKLAQTQDIEKYPTWFLPTTDAKLYLARSISRQPI